MQKPILLGNRNVGYIDTEKNVFITHRTEDIHKFRLFEGIGFNKDLIERLNVKEIWVFFHKDTGETILLKTTPQKVLEQGVEWSNKKDLKDKQLILTLDNFKVE
jgi:hypothetical protein